MTESEKNLTMEDLEKEMDDFCTQFLKLNEDLADKTLNDKFLEHYTKLEHSYSSCDKDAENGRRIKTEAELRSFF